MGNNPWWVNKIIPVWRANYPGFVILSSNRDDLLSPISLSHVSALGKRTMGIRFL
jgi:hypothetical protein